MKSRKAICSPQALDYLKERKEFRMVPAPVLFHINMNAELSVESRYLWNVIWNLCAMDKDYSRRLTWGYLSKHIGKSESSIRRWARPLQQMGYLEITQVFGKDGSQLPSVFRIGVPNAVAQEIAKKSPDRRAKKLEIETAETGKPDQNPAHIAGVHEVSEVEAEFRRDSGDPITVAEIESSVPSLNVADAESGETHCGSASECVDAETSADSGSSDCVSGIAPACHAESQTARMKIGAEKGTSRLQSILSRDRSRVGKGSESSHNARSEEKRLDVQGQHQTAYEREIEEIRIRALKLEKEAKKRVGEGAVKSLLPQAVKSGTQQKEVFKQVNNNNESDPVGKTIQRVRGELEKKIGIGAQIDRLAKEFTVAILFGAFKKFEFAKAINVGVKLVREGRWQPPRYSTDGEVVYAFNG